MPIVSAPCETEAGGLPELQSSRPGWATQQELVPKNERKSESKNQRKSEYDMNTEM